LAAQTLRAAMEDGQILGGVGTYNNIYSE
jgi:hypothetical protein